MRCGGGATAHDKGDEEGGGDEEDLPKAMLVVGLAQLLSPRVAHNNTRLRG